MLLSVAFDFTSSMFCVLSESIIYHVKGAKESPMLSLQGDAELVAVVSQTWIMAQL